MSILIQGMEMPTNCYFCPFCDYVSGRCDAVKGNPYTPESRYEKRADFCPLVPIPPHGRLIDADAVQETALKLVEDGWDITRNDYKRMDNILFECPTIIEAEGEK